MRLPATYSGRRPFAVLGLAWALLLLIFTVDAVWMLSAGFTYDMPAAAKLLATLFLLLGGATLVAVYVRPDANLLMFAQCSLLMALSGIGCGILCYLGNALNRPVIDEALIATDHTLGLDWLGYLRFMAHYPWLTDAMSLAYISLFHQTLLTIWLLALVKQPLALQRLMLAFLLCCLLTVIIAGAWPAFGGYVHYDINAEELGLGTRTGRIHEHDLIALRNGELRVLGLRLKGIITFPSFHAELAMLLAWATRGIKKWFPVSFALMLLTLMATPIDGGHYFIDIIGGFAVTLAAVFMANRLLPPETILTMKRLAKSAAVQ